MSTVSGSAVPGPMGCIIDQAVKERFWSTLPYEGLMQAAPELYQADDGKDWFLTDAEAAWVKMQKEAGNVIPWDLDSTGIYLLNHHQTTNDCTSHGTSGALEDLQMVDIMWRGVAEQFTLVASEPLYGGAIVTIMHTRGDNGAYTSAPLDYATKYGWLPRAKYGDIDLTKYSGARATAYSKSGVPATLLDTQKKQTLLLQVPIHNFEDASALLRQGYSVVGGSNQGFSMTRDKDGFCKPQGRWAHCTRFRGRRLGKKPGLQYGQSWGPGMPGGPSIVTLDDGRPLQLPEGGFFVDPDTFNSMVRQGEFYGLSKMSGLPVLDYKLWKD